MITVPDKFFRRLIMTLTGVFICSFSVGIFNLAAFGVDPFQCFAQGSYLFLAQYFQYGTYYFIISLVLLIIILLWDKHYVGLATFMNMFLTGYIVDYSYRVLKTLLPEVQAASRITLLVIAVVIMCFGSALYYTADLGVSVYDAISLIEARKKITIKNYTIPFKWIRVFNDLVCVLLGTVFGKLPGIGTLITAFFMGPLITFFNTTVAEPFLRMNFKHQRK